MLKRTFLFAALGMVFTSAAFAGECLRDANEQGTVMLSKPNGKKKSFYSFTLNDCRELSRTNPETAYFFYAYNVAVLIVNGEVISSTNK